MKWVVKDRGRTKKTWRQHPTSRPTQHKEDVVHCCKCRKLKTLCNTQRKMRSEWANAFLTPNHRIVNRIRQSTPMCTSIWNILPWANPSPYPKSILIGSAFFAQLTAKTPCIVQWAPLSPQNCSLACWWSELLLGVLVVWTPLNKWLLGPTRVHNEYPNGT